MIIMTRSILRHIRAMVMCMRPFSLAKNAVVLCAIALGLVVIREVAREIAATCPDINNNPRCWCTSAGGTSCAGETCDPDECWDRADCPGDGYWCAENPPTGDHDDDDAAKMDYTGLIPKPGRAFNNCPPEHDYHVKVLERRKRWRRAMTNSFDLAETGAIWQMALDAKLLGMLFAQSLGVRTAQMIGCYTAGPAALPDKFPESWPDRVVIKPVLGANGEGALHRHPLPFNAAMRAA